LTKYKSLVKRALFEYPNTKVFLDLVPDQIKMAKKQAEIARTPEERRRREGEAVRLQLKQKTAALRAAQIERALRTLLPVERLIVEYSFFERGEHENMKEIIDRVEFETGLCKSRQYEVRAAALGKLAISLYGIDADPEQELEPVVRCGACRFWQPNENAVDGAERFGCCEFVHGYREARDFCSCAEKRV
jgi:hypothetical protein